MTIKQTHVSSDGQERSCQAAPGRCPLRSDGSLNSLVQHSLYVDGEKLTPQHQTELYQLYENYHQFLTPEPNSTGLSQHENYLKQLNRFTEKYVCTDHNGHYPSLILSVKVYLPKPNPNPMKVVRTLLIPNRLNLNHTPEQTFQLRKTFEQHILAGVPEILAAQLTLSDPALFEKDINPAPIPDLTKPTLIPAFIQHVYLNSSNPEIIKLNIQNPNPHVDALDTYEHKHWTQGPIHNDNNRGTSYYMYDQLHRPAHLGPAYEYYPILNRRRYVQEYRENGDYPRPWTQGPAYTAYLDVSSTSVISEETPTEQSYFWRGERHRPWQDGPAHQTPYQTVYYHHGKLHRPREEGPAIEGVDANTGDPIKEYWEHGIRITEED